MYSQKVATKNDLPLPSENASGRYNNSFNINYLIPHQIAGNSRKKCLCYSHWSRNVGNSRISGLSPWVYTWDFGD